MCFQNDVFNPFNICVGLFGVDRTIIAESMFGQLYSGRIFGRDSAKWVFVMSPDAEISLILLNRG